MLDPDIRDKHDEWGNCEELLSVDDKKILDNGTWYRSSGDCVCKDCNKKYYDHPLVLGALWLSKLCNGNLVKL